MWHDEILEKIYRIREEHAKLFNYDFDAMFADLQRREAASGRQGRQVVNLSSKRRNKDTMHHRESPSVGS